MIFICIECGFEMDFDESEHEVIDCEECGDNMYAHPEMDV